MIQATNLREILRFLYGKEQNIAFLSKKTDLTYSGVLKNIQDLELKGLVKTEFRGRSRFVSITNKGEQVLVNLNNINKLCGNLIQ
jgi:DNA-binding MarR family transcriptional regulator